MKQTNDENRTPVKTYNTRKGEGRDYETIGNSLDRRKGDNQPVKS